MLKGKYTQLDTSLDEDHVNYHELQSINKELFYNRRNCVYDTFVAYSCTFLGLGLLCLMCYLCASIIMQIQTEKNNRKIHRFRCEHEIEYPYCADNSTYVPHCFKDNTFSYGTCRYKDPKIIMNRSFWLVSVVVVLLVITVCVICYMCNIGCVADSYRRRRNRLSNQRDVLLESTVVDV